MAKNLSQLGMRLISIAFWLLILAPSALRADEGEALACKIDEVIVPDLTDSKIVSAQGCKSAYYELCEKLVEQAQETCTNICRNFYTRSENEPHTFRICNAEMISTSIDAFDQTLNCKTESENVVVHCTVSYDCNCGP